MAYPAVSSFQGLCEVEKVVFHRFCDLVFNLGVTPGNALKELHGVVPELIEDESFQVILVQEAEWGKENGYPVTMDEPEVMLYVWSA